MKRIEFSKAARADRRAITAFTADRFGVRQARRLRDRFLKLLNLIANSPGIGRANPELDPPGRAFRYVVALRRIVIVYESTDDGIRVVRILHGARRLADELARDPDDES